MFIESLTKLNEIHVMMTCGHECAGDLCYEMDGGKPS